MLKEHITQLEKELELPYPLGQEGGDYYALLLENTKIIIEKVLQGFQLSANLGEVGEELQESFFTTMLRGNLFAQATDGSFLGLDETGKNAVLQFFHPEKASYREFKEALEDFMNCVDFWNEQIEEHKKNPQQV